MKAETIDVGWVDPEHVSGFFAHSIAEQLRDMEYFGCAGKVHRFTASQPIVARNHMFQSFLDNSDAPWLWTVDADEVFDKKHPMKLWEVASEYQVKMVSGLVMIFMNQRTPVPSIFWEDEEGGLVQVYNHIPVEPTEIAACGLGSVLLHRDVVESLSAPRHPAYRWFDFLPNEEVGINGDEMTGIDVQFFVRARRLGHKLMLAPDARTLHIEQVGVGYHEWEKTWSNVQESDSPAVR